MNTMTFEQANEQLNAVLEEISDEETPLDRCLTLYAQAAQLIAFCEETLKKAQITVEEIDARLQETQES